MTRCIWKFPVVMTDAFILPMPSGAEILCVQSQHERGWIWAIVDPDAPLIDRVFRLVGTGHPIAQSKLLYIGTFQQHAGALVWHLFEVGI